MPRREHRGHVPPEYRVRPRTPMLLVGAIRERHWVVTIDDDPTPLSRHDTRFGAEASARLHAQDFGYPEIFVYRLNGERELILLDDPDPQPPYPGAARGHSAA